jgi:hypothetical protein
MLGILIVVLKEFKDNYGKTFKNMGNLVGIFMPS